MEKARKYKNVAVTKTVEKTAAHEPADASQEAKRKPVATLRAEDCSASVWAREALVQGKPTIFYSVTLERSYKARDGAWRYTRSFDASSLGKLVSLCHEAAETISALEDTGA